MREILFRGKTKQGEWVEGNLFIPDRLDTPTQICVGTDRIRITYDIIPETVGQFINRTDEKGNKIFVGDIVEYSNGDIGAICYNELASAYIVVFDGGDWDYLHVENGACEVIGNIWDDPELIGFEISEQLGE